MGSVLARISRSTATRSAVNIKRPPPPQHGGGSQTDNMHRPNQELLDRLKDVYVSSTTDVVSQTNPYASERVETKNKLPQERRSQDTDNFVLPKASEGYLTIDQLIDVFDKQKMNREEWTPARVSSVYNIDQSDAENLLKFFDSYKVVGRFKRQDPEMALHHLTE